MRHDEEAEAFNRDDVQPLIAGVKAALKKRGAKTKIANCTIDYVNDQWVRCFISLWKPRAFSDIGTIQVSYYGERRVTQRRSPEKFNADKIAANLIEAAVKMEAATAVANARYERGEARDRELEQLREEIGDPLVSVSGHPPTSIEMTLRCLTREQCIAIGKALAQLKEGTP